MYIFKHFFVVCSTNLAPLIFFPVLSRCHWLFFLKRISGHTFNGCVLFAHQPVEIRGLKVWALICMLEGLGFLWVGCFFCVCGFLFFFLVFFFGIYLFEFVNLLLWMWARILRKFFGFWFFPFSFKINPELPIRGHLEGVTYYTSWK